MTTAPPSAAPLAPTVPPSAVRAADGPPPSAAGAAPNREPHHAWERGQGGGPSGPPGGPAPAAGGGPGHLWDAVTEDEHGNLVVAGGEASLSLAEALRERRKRRDRADHALQSRRVVRDMLRYVYVLLDASRWARSASHSDAVALLGGAGGGKTWLDASVALLSQWVPDFYDQNPLSHLGFVLAANGEAEILSPLGNSSSAKSHQRALRSVAQLLVHSSSKGSKGGGGSGGNDGGEFSLQNGLEVAGRSLGHQPPHGSREVVALVAALGTCDPGSLLRDTLPKLKRSRVRVSCFALSAELHVCRVLSEQTGGTLAVCLDRQHFREWWRGQCVPPPKPAETDDWGDDGGGGGSRTVKCEMIPMGFPTRTTSDVPTLVHASAASARTAGTVAAAALATTSYACPQCQAKNQALPCDCAVCGLKLVLAPHLARSFHHLFPVPPFSEAPALETAAPDGEGDHAAAPEPTVVSSSSSSSSSGAAPTSRLIVTSKEAPTACFACCKSLHWTDPSAVRQREGNQEAAQQQLLRFQCPDCNSCFCVDCDAYLHETLHNCPGCLRLF